MAAFVNDRTVLIMSAVPRFTPPNNRGMFLSPDSAVFKMASDGQSASPASFTFKATLLNMSGAVAFTCSAGITPTVNGNEVTVTYANFTAVTGTITATITVDGVQYTQVATLTKVADGANGAAGPQGSRGNVDIAAVTSATVWSDSEAVAALAAAGYGAPKPRDMVTLYKADRTFSVQKMYNGTVWVAVDYVYNGNMFVKGSILPEAIDTRGLAIRDAQGNVILGSGSALPAAYAAPGTLNSDVTLGTLGFTGDKNANYTSASKGAALNDDPAIENASSWSLSPNVSIVTGAGGAAVTSNFLNCSSGTNQFAVSRRRFSVDPARTYSLTAMLYTAAGNARDMYLYVNFYDVSGAQLWGSPIWGGSMSGYTFGGLPPVGWTRQGANFGAGTTRAIPAGTVAAEVGVWFQYSQGSGSVQQAAQDIRLEDVTVAAAAATTASNAQSDATAALGRLTSISSDSKLDRSEKADVERAWEAVYAEHAGLVSQASSLGVSYSDWENRYYELQSYLSAIPGWGNHGTDSDIDRGTYNTRWNNYYSARQALLNAFAAKAATTATWAGTSGRPSDDAIRNNMLDLSWWKRDASIPWILNNEFNRIVTCGLESGADVAIAGPRGGSDLVWYACEVTGNGESGGGWNGPSIAIDPNKTYRFVVPICRLEGTGSAYWGTENVCALNTQNAIGNPYFAIASGLTLNRWYLFVGYIYPAGSSGNTNESAGIWDCVTGEKIAIGQNYCSKSSDPAVYFRAYQYYASPNAKQVFGRPMINVVDGTEPSLREYFSASAMLNSQQQWGDVKGAGKPADNATVGAVIGQNLSGQFSKANISTYIQAATIGLALIDKASIGNLSALSATIGTLRTSTSGARTEISDNVYKVFDSNNIKRVQLGDSSL